MTPATADLSGKPHNTSVNLGTLSGQGETLVAAQQDSQRLSKLNNPMEILVALFIFALIIATFIYGRWYWNENTFTPEEGFGYYLGMTGGIIMLLAYIYAMRKYIPGLRGIGKLKPWLRAHIFFGVVGPAMLMVHSTYHIGSVNGGMALISMLLVVASGVIGRYFYSRVHFGLYGRKAELDDVKQVLFLRESKVKKRLCLTPEIKTALNDYETYVIKKTKTMRVAPLVLLGANSRCKRLHRKIGKQLEKALRKKGAKKLSRREIKQRTRYAKRMLWFYLSSLKKLVQFAAYERLLSSWRMIHVPLLYLLFVSGVFHVIAVHMY